MLRAVENRVPMVVSSNSGPSHIVDVYGRVIVQARSIFSEEVVSGDVKLGSGGTLYTSIDDVFVFIMIGTLTFAVLWQYASARISHRLSKLSKVNTLNAS